MMLTKIRNLLPFGRTDDDPHGLVEGAIDVVEAAEPAQRDAMRELVEHLHYEIVPMKSIDQAMEDLPPASNVSVTCSPVQGIAATQHYTDRLLELGHRPIPHLAARLVESAAEAAELARWFLERELSEVFVIAGDAPEPTGPYEGALAFIEDFLGAGPGVQRVGFAGYPDGHAMIDNGELSRQIHAKQAALDAFGVGGWVSTQMCFDEVAIRGWIGRERADGLHLPVRLGVPGVVDRTRLMTMGTRLGIGASMRYLAKNRSTVMHLMSPGGYDPTDMVVGFAEDADDLGIETLHAFTFNAVADTRAWQETIVAGGRG